MATTFAVPDGRVAMAATTYTGDGTTSRSIVNTVNTVSFQPDLIWVKARTLAGVAYGSHSLTDSVRGANLILSSDLTDAEANVVTSFGNGGVGAPTSNGFTLVSGTAGNANNYNANTATFVGWQWNAGGTTVTNGTGTISSQVRANTTAGFSVVTYTGNGSASATVGHGLGVIPGMVITKGRSGVTEWMVKHQSLPTGQNLILNQTLDAPTSLTFSGGVIANLTNNATFGFTTGSVDVANANGSGVTYVAYCWTPVAGYSAFGSYTGNGSADGPFIYTGFRPRFVLYKKYSAAGNDWRIWDSSRNTSNATTLGLYPDTAVAEDTSAGPIDILSNGFKLRTAGAGDNGSGDGFIYAAFAENPLKYANAR